MMRELRFLVFACSVPLVITLWFMWGMTKLPIVVAAPEAVIGKRVMQVSSADGNCHAIVTLSYSTAEKKEP